MQKLDHFHFKYYCSENNIVWGRFSDACIIMFFLVSNWYVLFLRLWAIWLFWNNNNNDIRIHNHKFKGCVSQWYSLNNSIVMKHDYIFWFWILVFLHNLYKLLSFQETTYMKIKVRWEIIEFIIYFHRFKM